MKKLKLLIRIMFYTLCFLSFCVAVLHFTLIYVAPLDSVKEKIITTVKEQTSADIKIGSISASIFDFQVKDIELSADGNKIAYIKTIYLHLSPIQLLKMKVQLERITLDGLNLTIEKDKDGKFNFASILESPAFKKEVKEELAQEQKPAEKEDKKDETSIIDLLLNRTHINDCKISFTDGQNNMAVCLSGISFHMKRFDFSQEFKIGFSTDISASFNGITIDRLNVALNAYGNLNNMNLSKAEIRPDSLILRLNDTVITVKGKIADFTNPRADLTVKILNLCSQNLVNITELPEFKIPQIDITSSTNINLNEGIAKINNLKIDIFDSSVQIDGTVNYGSDKLAYDINVIINLILDKLCQTVELTKEYSPKGNIKAELKITDEPSVVKGKCILENISASAAQIGEFTEINSEIKISSIKDVVVPSLTGILNKYPFKASASYITGNTKGDIKADFTADRVFGYMSKEYEEKQKNKTANSDQKPQETVADNNSNDNKSTQTEQQNSSIVPLDVLVTANIKDIDVPYFKGKNVGFKMDMKNVTPDMQNVEGVIDLSTADGIIKDVYKLTDSNIVVKSMFMSLKVVSDVINALNILDILESIGSAVTSSGKEETEDDMTEEHKQEQNKKMDGKIDFVSFVTLIDFAQGKGVFKKCSFVSNLMSFKVSGEMSFKANSLDMTVNAAPGRHEEEGGIMPLTVKIGGTMDEPSGSLSLLGSVATLVGDALTKNILSENLKSGFMSLLGLKKHDDTGAEIPEPQQK